LSATGSYFGTVSFCGRLRSPPRFEEYQTLKDLEI
jgi:hypothetical protein